MKITKELLERYVMGECTAEEEKAVEEWTRLSSNSPTDLPIIKREHIDSKKIWSTLSKAAPGLEDQPQIRKSKTLSMPRRITRYAAAVLILCAVGFSAYYLADLWETTGSTQELYQTVNTKRGEKRTVKLPDGSTIRMNYETEIEVPEQFEGNERVVYLTGHAHFNVARDIERPFIIYTEDSKTEVLGTSFDINTKGADETEIIVTSGKVAFSQKDKESNRVTLIVNDQAVLDADKRIATREVDALTLTAWKDNRLVFEGKTLKEVIEVLEPWYDVEIAVEDPSYLEVAFSLSGDNPTLEAFLKELCFAGRFSYRIEGKQVTLY